MVKIKKGGERRAILERIHYLDSFVVPAGFRIDGIYTEKIDTDAVDVSLGSSNGVVEKAVFTVTGPAATAGGTITIAGVGIEVSQDDTAEKIATLIAAGTFSGWRVSRNAATLTFLATGEGNKTNVTAVDTDTTGTTFSAVTTTAGTFPEDVMATVSLSTAGVASQTIAKSVFSTTADTTVYVNMSNPDAIVNLYVQMSKFN